MKTYIKKTNKKTNEELYFMGFIPLSIIHTLNNNLYEKKTNF